MRLDVGGVDRRADITLRRDRNQILRHGTLTLITAAATAGKQAAEQSQRYDVLRDAHGYLQKKPNSELTRQAIFVNIKTGFPLFLSASRTMMQLPRFPRFP